MVATVAAVITRAQGIDAKFFIAGIAVCIVLLVLLVLLYGFTRR